MIVVKSKKKYHQKTGMAGRYQMIVVKNKTKNKKNQAWRESIR